MKYIITTILPILFTGIVTGIVNNIQQKNKDNSKKEIAYDKVYYPLYTYLSGKTYEKMNKENMNKYIGEVLQQNDKYISKTTKVYFEHYLQTSNNNENVKTCEKAYEKFLQHILDYNWKLRYDLGYVRGSFWEVFDSFSSVLKTSFFLVIMLLICDVLAVIHIFFDWDLVTLLLGLFILLFLGLLLAFFVLVIKELIYNKMMKSKKTKSDSK